MYWNCICQMLCIRNFFLPNRLISFEVGGTGVYPRASDARQGPTLQSTNVKISPRLRSCYTRFSLKNLQIDVQNVVISSYIERQTLMDKWTSVISSTCTQTLTVNLPMILLCFSRNVIFKLKSLKPSFCFKFSFLLGHFKMPELYMWLRYIWKKTSALQKFCSFQMDLLLVTLLYSDLE